MNDMPQDAWFYSHEGERIGPVTFADLQIKAKEGALNPRLDLVWKHGMDEWKPSGEIEGLFERRAAPEEKESLAPAADPYAPPKLESVESQMNKLEGWPGARRRRYLFTLIALPFLLNFGIATITVTFEEQLGKQTAGWIILGVLILTCVVMISTSLQRLVNLGMSRWWFLGNLVPFLNIWVGYRSFACPAGYAYHKKLDGAGIFLAIVYWLGSLIVILACVLLIGVLSGVIGSPELRKRAIDAYHEGVERKKQEIENARHK